MENNTIKSMQDQLRNSAPGDIARATFSREVDGVKLSAEISPCVWMYEGYPLQITITMADGGGDIHLTDKTKNFKTATPAAIEAMLAGVKVCKCKNKACKNLAFDPAVAQTNRKGECEHCFMKKLKASFAELQAKEDAKLKALDVSHKAKGFTHRVSAWVHPKQGGSDYQIDLYTKGRMTDVDVQKLLKKKGSAVTNDFQIIEL